MQYCIVCIDSFTKYVWGCPIPTKETTNVTSFLLKTFAKGEIEKLHSDNGGEFISDEMIKVWLFIAFSIQ